MLGVRMIFLWWNGVLVAKNVNWWLLVIYEFWFKVGIKGWKSGIGFKAIFFRFEGFTTPDGTIILKNHFMQADANYESRFLERWEKMFKKDRNDEKIPAELWQGQKLNSIYKMKNKNV